MKRLTFAFVIVLSLFVLGGCDQLLEGFFPYDTDTDKSVSGDADYSVAVMVNYASELDEVMQYGGSIMVALIPFYQNYDGGIAVNTSGIIRMPLSQYDFESDNDGRDDSTTLMFTTWSPSIYKVLVWVDYDLDERFTYEIDPNAQYSEPAAFAFRTDSYEEWIDLSYVQPQRAGIDMVCTVSGYSTVESSDFSINPYDDPNSTSQIVTQTVVGLDTYMTDVQQISDYQFYISTPGYYLINWEDSYESSTYGLYSGDITASYIDGYGTYLFTDVDSGYNYPQQVYVDSVQYITIRANPFYSPGTCRIWITPAP